MTVEANALREFVDGFWDDEILPVLSDYIRIPALSVAFDAAWQRHGHLERARRLALDWLGRYAPADWTIESRGLAGRTPVILIEVPGESDQTVLLYGHLDKQPEMEGWSEGFGPWSPVFRGDRLYGRGAADDGYALFAAVAALRSLRRQKAPHARAVILIEFSEESGSPDLAAYLDEYVDLIGTPDLIIALDSGAGDYARLWSTTSLRGIINGVLKVQVLAEGAHSGIAGGIIPDSTRLLRQLLDRVEDARTGDILLPELHTDTPPARLDQARAAARLIGTGLLNGFQTTPGLQPAFDDPVELLLANTWRPMLTVVGQDGLPPAASAGNVLRPHTALKLSFRLPPTTDCNLAREALVRTLTADPPHNARVTLEFEHCAQGWDAPPLAPWLERATNEASRAQYGHPAAFFGLGASIPFAAMLGARFPQAQFLITGVLGPNSNAHGPNEFLDLTYAKGLTACIAQVLDRHFEAGFEG